MPDDADRAGVRIELVEYHAAWSELYQAEAAGIRAALGGRVLLLKHVGSTSVPGLRAKPIIDICLGVADPADEAGYMPDLELAGYRLRLREPDWFEHRLFACPRHPVNLHVFAAGSPEVDRMIRFRDRLRVDAADRGLYERAKLALASRPWPSVQAYADAKSRVVEAILARTPSAGSGVVDP